MKHICMVIAIVSLCSFMYAQNEDDWIWANQAGSDQLEYLGGFSIDNNGNGYLTGYINGTAYFGSIALNAESNPDLYIAKIDSNGNWLWAVSTPGTGYSRGESIAVDDMGNVYVAGSFSESISFGSTELNSIGDSDIFIAKMDSQGTWVWAKRAGSSEQDRDPRIALDGNNNVYMTGDFTNSITLGDNTLQSVGSRDIYVGKLDTYGSWLWSVRAGGSGVDFARGITLDSNDNPCIIGSFTGTSDFGANSVTSTGIYDIYVAKMNGSGAWLWAQSAGGLETENGNSIITDSNNNILITGNFQQTSTFGSISLSSLGSNDIYVAKLNTNGEWLWAISGGGSSSDDGKSIAVDNLGNSYIGGWIWRSANFGSNTVTSAGSRDIVTAKIDADGNWLGAKRAGGYGDDYSTKNAVDQYSNVFIAGQFQGTASWGNHNLTSYGDANLFAAKVHDSYPNANEPPSTAQAIEPVNNETQVNPIVSLTWTCNGGVPMGYLMSFGTDNPPTNIANNIDLGYVQVYDPPGGLSMNTDYYWQIKPYNTYGVASNCPIWSFSTLTSDAFAGGSGTLNDPYLIANANHLNNIRSFLGEEFGEVHFQQISDINLGETPWQEIEGWQPIGNENTKFFGNYNGNNYSIDNLYINRPFSSSQALFGGTYSSTFVNVDITNADVTGSQYCGSLVGLSSNTSFSNCSSTGNINGTYQYTGGLIGYFTSSQITECSSGCNVSSSGQMVGGLVGSAGNAQITGCNTYGDIEGTNGVGGVVGNLQSSSLVSSYSSANVEATGSSVGGLVGSAQISSSISSCYNTNNVTGQENAGGIAGSLTNSMIEGCHNTGQISGTNHVGGLVGHTTTSIITNTYSVCNVNGSGNYVGGLVGSITNSSTIHTSFSKGDVTGVDHVGGVTGSQTNISSISDCYSMCNVNGSDYIGGLVGYNRSSSVLRSFCMGIVSGISNVGGLAGAKVVDTGYMDNGNYWNTETSLMNTSQMGLGRTTDEMTYPYAADTYIDWNFDDIWSLDTDYSNNDGYPYLHDVAGSSDQIPSPAINSTPPDLASSVPVDADLGWDPDINALGTNAPTGYQLWIGTDNPPTNFVIGLDLGFQDCYDSPVVFMPGVTYYWQVVPYNHLGEAVNCPIWSFSTHTNPHAEIDVNQISFGNVWIDHSATKSLTISNQGAQNLEVTLLVSSGPFSISTSTGRSLRSGPPTLTSKNGRSTRDEVSLIVAPASSETVAVHFLPTGQQQYSRNLFIETNAPNLLLATIPLTGTGYNLFAEFEANPIIGDMPLEVSFANQSVAGITQSHWDFGDGNTTDETNPTHTFAQEGVYNVQLTVWDEYFDTSVTHPVTVIAHALLACADTLSYNLGMEYLGDMSDIVTLALQSVGTDTLYVNNISWQYGSPGFQYSYGDYATPILPGNFATIDIWFQPMVQGAFSDSLIIETNAENMPVLKVKVMGSGEYVPPKPPENVTILMNGYDAVISWDEVIQTIYDSPFTPDGYLVFYNGSSDPENGLYYYLAVTTDLTHTHIRVGEFAQNMFYHVIAYCNYGRDGFDISSLNLEPGMPEEEVLKRLSSSLIDN